jgi:hypothetical protein
LIKWSLSKPKWKLLKDIFKRVQFTPSILHFSSLFCTPSVSELIFEHKTSEKRLLGVLWASNDNLGRAKSSFEALDINAECTFASSITK